MWMLISSNHLGLGLGNVMLICFIIFQMVDFKLHFLEGAYDSKALSLVSYISPEVGELILSCTELSYYPPIVFRWFFTCQILNFFRKFRRKPGLCSPRKHYLHSIIAYTSWYSEFVESWSTPPSPIFHLPLLLVPRAPPCVFQFWIVPQCPFRCSRGRRRSCVL